MRKLQGIDPQIISEMNEINIIRIRKNLSKLSYRKQTQLFVRHRLWHLYKRDIINYVDGEDE